MSSTILGEPTSEIEGPVGCQSTDEFAHFCRIEGTFQPFLSDLFGLLDERYPLPQGLQVLPDDAIMPPTFELRFLDEEHNGESNGSSSGSSGTLQNNGDSSSRVRNGVGHHDASMVSSSSTTADSDIRWMSTVKNERITSLDHWQDVRRLEFTLPDSDEVDLNYEAGDIATLRPANGAGMVDALITRMGWSQHRDRPVGLFDRQGRRIQLPPLSKPLTDAGAVEETMTLHSYLVNHTSPFSPLRPSLFPLLRPFSPKGHLEREKLDEFCTPGDGYEDAMEYGVRTRRTIAEVLDEFQSVQFEPRWAAEVFGGGNEEGEGGMREREFSIACGPSVSVKVEQGQSFTVAECRISTLPSPTGIASLPDPPHLSRVVQDTHSRTPRGRPVALARYSRALTRASPTRSDQKVIDAEASRLGEDSADRDRPGHGDGTLTRPSQGACRPCPCPQGSSSSSKRSSFLLPALRSCPPPLRVSRLSTLGRPLTARVV